MGKYNGKKMSKQISKHRSKKNMPENEMLPEICRYCRDKDIHQGFWRFIGVYVCSPCLVKALDKAFDYEQETT